MKTYLLLLFGLLHLPVTAMAIQFDMWETGMSQAEMIAVSASNDIPLKKVGITSTSSGFNPQYINTDFYKATAVGYETTILERNTTVVLKLTEEEPKKLYEIEVQMHGEANDEKFNRELMEILTNKYGPPMKTFNEPGHKTIAWQQGDYGQIFWKKLSRPVIVYRDIKTKLITELREKSSDIVQINGFSILDIGKF